MQYVLQIISDETRPLPSAGELAKLSQAYFEFTRGIVESQHFRAGVQLERASKATTVREKNGKRMVTDGPFVEAKEHVAGCYVVECAHLDEAIAIAGRVPGVRLGEAVEIRPIVPPPRMG